MGSFEVRVGDCIALMRDMPAGSVDAIVTDPPYGLGFMGREWDALPPGLEWAEECLRVLKPGGHLLAFGGTRTFHRLACAVEDAGFEVRDTIAWMYGSGFPKSLDVSKAIDKAAGAEREVTGPNPYNALRGVTTSGTWKKGEQTGFGGSSDMTAPATPEAEQWEGWGTALKPAFEPVVVARKPLCGTVAGNVLAHGTGALNVDGCRVEGPEPHHNYGRTSGAGSFVGASDEPSVTPPGGRWPANVVLDEEAAALLDEQTGDSTAGKPRADRGTGGIWSEGDGVPCGPQYGDQGGASRFFYTAKASTAERNAGLDGFTVQRVRQSGHKDERVWDIPGSHSTRRANFHPTVKPIDLMRWLVRLVTPPGGTVLDPFTGSGSTGCAAMLEGFNFIGCEREAEYAAIAEARIRWWSEQPQGMDVDTILEGAAMRGKVEATGQQSLV